jgi:5-methylcytosine-specific restriction protein B
MNDIDRSVESMDFAFRRRFAFQEITAEDTMDSILYKLGDDMNDAVNKMRAINSTLDTLGLNSNYHIGAAYFKKVENSENKSNKWNDLWNLHLKGTLFEYFRGEPDADNKIEQLKDAYDNANKENNK